jgi:hypothetical protein
MSSGDGRPQKSPDFSPEKKEIGHLTIFRQKKKGLMSLIVELSYAETTNKPKHPKKGEYKEIIW